MGVLGSDLLALPCENSSPTCRRLNYQLFNVGEVETFFFFFAVNGVMGVRHPAGSRVCKVDSVNIGAAFGALGISSHL